MKPSHFILGLVTIICSCSKEESSPPGFNPFPHMAQVAGTVITSTCSCTNPWSGKYPVIIQLDDPVFQQQQVYTTNLPDSFKKPGSAIIFDVEFERAPRNNWCDGISLPEEVQLFNVRFE